MLRLWIALLALTAFGAGTGAGLLWAQRLQPEDPRPFSDYEKLFLEQFDLGPSRVEVFRELLAAYANDLDLVERKHLASYRSSMEPDLTRLARDYSDLLRNHVLRGDDRLRFDALAQGQPTFDPVPESR